MLRINLVAISKARHVGRISETARVFAISLTAKAVRSMRKRNTPKEGFACGAIVSYWALRVTRA